MRLTLLFNEVVFSRITKAQAETHRWCKDALETRQNLQQAAQRSRSRCSEPRQGTKCERFTLSRAARRNPAATANAVEKRAKISQRFIKMVGVQMGLGLYSPSGRLSCKNITVESVKNRINIT